ncbi:diphthine synthase [Candidatus Woesearchaeota archaeon]|jgi:diphthine synthase|nr:diphthine synthase [Candidatus Woesearchaeota archaeon]
MTLYFIGIGLDNEQDITVKGLEIIKKSDKIFLESYTSKLNCPIENLEKLYGKKVIIANRELVEKTPDEILDSTKDIAFLVIGDALGATTHLDLMIRAKQKNIPTKLIHNTSIINAVGVTGLELYKFGKTTSMPFFEPNFIPQTPYNILSENLSIGAHTLILLDIKTDQNRFMTINQAIKQLLELENKLEKHIFSENTICIGCARLGANSQTLKAGTAKELLNFDFGAPLHSLIIPGKLHFMEEEAIELLK